MEETARYHWWRVLTGVGRWVSRPAHVRCVRCELVSAFCLCWWQRASSPPYTAHMGSPPPKNPVDVTHHAINHRLCLAHPLASGVCAPHVRRCLLSCYCIHSRSALTAPPPSPPCAAFFYNAIIILATLFAGVNRPGLQWWFLSLLVITLGVPLSWWLFYKSIFRAAQTDGATYSYIRAFMLTLLHMVGAPGWWSRVCVVFG